ncbi:MAG TPA: transposase [Azospirillum sp.]|nr:transposase [Azospirillum sp.]
MEIITGRERRREWSEGQKRALVAAAFAPGAVVTQVARRADVSASLLYRWRREQAALEGGFAAVMVTPDRLDAGAMDGSAMEIEVGGVARLRIPPSTPPALAASVVAALVQR